jgi:ATP-binding protein involved in chromosome partitioning
MDPPRLSRQSPAPLPIIAVASGKGGVGKSSVAVAVGRELVRSGRKVGLVDADIAGPDVPRMLGLRRDVPATSVTLAAWAGGGQGRSGLEAMDVGGLKVASAGFLIGGHQGLALGSGLGDLMLGRLINELREVRTPVLGGVENMAYFQCPCCGTKTELHAPAPDGRTIWAGGVERLARLPFRPDAAIDSADLTAVLDAVTAHIAA